jgi:tetratricopeptide (TPR) repeat protein
MSDHEPQPYDGLLMIAAAGRQAAAARDWRRVNACGLEIRRQAPMDPEGPFLLGLASKNTGHLHQAAENFREVISLDSSRYDAAIELAFQYVLLNRIGDAKALLDQYRDNLDNSPIYLNLAGESYSRLNLHEDALPLFERACQLQPDVEIFNVSFAKCAVSVGKIDTAKSIYKDLLRRNPAHRRNHYELANLERAKNDRHIKKMLKVLRKSDDEPSKNIYLYYALGKELEDLGRWNEAFNYYKKAGDAVKTVSDHDVADDVAVMDKIIDVCTGEWIANKPATDTTTRTPVFVVGMPRTGTTLTERILSSHSQMDSVGETQLLQMVLRRKSKALSGSEITPSIIEAAAQASPASIASDYIDAVSYRVSDLKLFVEKLPENVLYLGFIAKSWPNARIIHMRRHPMDACFANYKQSYFRFAYSLDDVADYYLAYDRLSRHWRDTLGDRMIEVEYESLVSDPELETRRMLDSLNLPFEDACLQFDRNVTSIATASSVQVRDKMHTRSVGKWKNFERQLRPLRDKLEQGGIAI